MSSRLEALGQRLGLRLLFRVADLGDLLLALDLPLVGVGHRQRQLARQQVVARVAGRHLDDVAAPAEVVDVFSENDFH